MGFPVHAGGSSVCVRGVVSGIMRGVLTAVLLFIAAGLRAQDALAAREKVYEKQILESARDHGVDPMLVKAIIFTESSFFPDKQGKDGEIGLMQIRPSVAEDWAKSREIPAPSAEEMYDPDLNIEIGTWCIARALKRWYSNPDFLRMALAEYNAGRKRLLQWFEMHNGDTDELLASKSVGKYADRVCRKYVEYTILGADWDELQPKFAQNR